MGSITQQHSPARARQLNKGKYVFINNLSERHHTGASIPYFSAEAILITTIDGVPTGEIDSVNLSDLILKQSTYIDAHGRAIEAHKLYTWPRNLGSTAAWTAAKLEFLTSFVLHYPIEVISLQPENGVTWRYISPEAFKQLPEGLQASPAFADYAAHQEDYFFLRQPLSDPQ